MTFGEKKDANLIINFISPNSFHNLETPRHHENLSQENEMCVNVLCNVNMWQQQQQHGDQKVYQQKQLNN